MTDPDRVARLKRFAFQIAVQLPGDKDEAIQVLEYVTELLEWECGGTPPKLHVVQGH